MGVIFLVVIGSAVIVSAIGYLIFSTRVRNTDHSYYWKAAKSGSASMEKIKKEFLENEHQIKAFKEIIGFSIRCRNTSNQVLNEITGLYNQKIENQLIRQLDLQILEQLYKEFSSLKSEIKINFYDDKSPHSGDLKKWTKNLRDNFSNLFRVMETLMQATDNERNSLHFIEGVKSNAETLHHKIVSMHESIISLFQSYFSEIE
jgi:hypothetical protein